MDDALVNIAAAYEGVEDRGAFANAESLERYRAKALERSRPQADLLAPLLPPGARVLEVGSGNGRLLVELTRRGAIGDALGVDVAASRTAFARAWAADLGLDGLHFEPRDALALDAPSGSFDAVLCITGALAYFGAARPRRDVELLAAMSRATAPGGLVCLEVYPHPRLQRLLEHTGGEARTWYELAPDDPWRFYLSHYRLQDGVLHHAKTFVHRRTGAIDEGRAERLYLYSESELGRLLESAGFVEVEAREGWSPAPYAGGETLVCLGRRGEAEPAP